MMKINPFLSKKLLGLTTYEWLGIVFSAFCAQAESDLVQIQNRWIDMAVYIATWVLAFGLYSVIIALIKTFITKEE